MFNKLVIALTVATVFSTPISGAKEKGSLEVNENQFNFLTKRAILFTPEDAPAKKEEKATPPEKKEGIKFPDFNTVGEQVTKTFNDFTKGANPGAVEKEVKEKKEEADKKVADAKKAVDPKKPADLKKDGNDKKAAK